MRALLVGSFFLLLVPLYGKKLKCATSKPHIMFQSFNSYIHVYIYQRITPTSQGKNKLAKQFNSILLKVFLNHLYSLLKSTHLHYQVPYCIFTPFTDN